MRKVLFFTTALLLVSFASKLNAQRLHEAGEPKFSNSFAPVSDRISAAGQCDTVSLDYPVPGPLVLYTSNAWGFASGHNDYGDLAFAERIQNYNGITKVFGIRFDFGWGSSSGPNAHVMVKVWPEASNAPGTELYSTDLTIDSIIAANGHITMRFPSPVTVNGPFYVGYEVIYAPGDTVAVFGTRDSTISPSTAWSKFSNGSWYPFDDGSNSWGLQVALAIYPIVLDGNFQISVLPSVSTISLGGQIQLNASFGSSFDWYPSNSLSCSPCSNPIASPTVTTDYVIAGWDSTHTCTDLGYATVNVNVVSIEDGLFGGKATAFPNPSTGKVMLQFTQQEIADLQITVTNQQGQIIRTESLPAFQGEYQSLIDLDRLAAGFYYLQVTDGNRKFVQKLILE